MKHKLVFTSIIISCILIFSGCGQTENQPESFEEPTTEVVVVKPTESETTEPETEPTPEATFSLEYHNYQISSDENGNPVIVDSIG